MYSLLLALLATVNVQDGEATLDRLLACEDVAEALRLACYDAQVRAIRERRSQVAGVLDAPKKEPVAFKPIDSTVKAVSSLRPGFWRVSLADGSMWQNSDWTGVTPQAGKAMSIRKGALNSLWAKSEGVASVKVRAVR